MSGDYTVAVVPPGPPYVASGTTVPAPAPAPVPADSLSPGRDYGFGSGWAPCLLVNVLLWLSTALLWKLELPEPAVCVPLANRWFQV